VDAITEGADPDALLNGRLGRAMLARLAGTPLGGTLLGDTPLGGTLLGGTLLGGTDPLALLLPVAEVAGEWAFGSGWADVTDIARLRPLAEAVAAAPGAGWWWQPVQRARQRWLGCQHHRTLARGAAVTREVSAQPRRGEWWSGPVGDSVRTSRGDIAGLAAVALACAEDPFGAEDFDIWALTVPAAARVYEVHGPADWARLAQTYPRDVTAARGDDWWDRWAGAKPGRRWILPDWPAAAGDWDGVHVSVAGYLSTAGSAISAGAAGDTLLAGWDADQTLWLRDVFTDAGPLTTWHGTPGPEAIAQR
jgi:hypothetical protein